MAREQIKPHRITKPMQLLAAWLVSLLALDGAFLAGARFIQSPDWAPLLLVIAAIINVPLFLGCLFILLTKFRPEMLEDPYYASYLDQVLAAGKEEFKGTPVEITSLGSAIDEARPIEEPAVMQSFEGLQEVLDVLEGLAENWPVLVVQESWLHVEASLDKVARQLGLPNSRGLYVLQSEIKRVFGPGLPPAWVAKVFYRQFRSLWRAAREADSSSVIPEQAIEFARQAINVAWLIQNLEQYKDWHTRDRGEK